MAFDVNLVALAGPHVRLFDITGKVMKVGQWFNLFRLGHKWFEGGVTKEVDRLLIHELGHQYSGDHLSEEYHEALCMLSARIKGLALEKAEALKKWRKR